MRNLTHKAGFIIFLLSSLFLLGGKLLAQAEVEIVEDEYVDHFEEEYTDDYYEVSPFDAYADEPLPVPEVGEQTWEKASGGLEYLPGKTKPEPKKKEDTNDNASGSDWSWEGVPGGSIFLKGVVVLGAVVILFFLLRAVLGLVPPSNRKVKASEPEGGIDLEQIEENLDKEELNPYIAQAEAAGNYGLAVRLYFLQALQKLTQGEYIRWKRDKTNRTYLRELQGTPYRQSFVRLTNVFEEVWYGAHAIDESLYRRLVPDFQAFIQEIDIPE